MALVGLQSKYQKTKLSSSEATNRLLDHGIEPKKKSCVSYVKGQHLRKQTDVCGALCHRSLLWYIKTYLEQIDVNPSSEQNPHPLCSEIPISRNCWTSPRRIRKRLEIATRRQSLHGSVANVRHHTVDRSPL